METQNEEVGDEAIERSRLLAQPYTATLDGKFDTLEKFYRDHQHLFSEPLSVFEDTVIHLAVDSMPKATNELALRVIKKLSVDSLKKKNKLGNTVLSEVARTDNVELAKMCLDKCEELLELENDIGDTPLFIAAACGKTKMVKLLAGRVSRMDQHLRRTTDSNSILHMAICGQGFDTALEVMKLEGVDPQWIDERGMTCLQLLANMPSAFRSRIKLGIFSEIIYVCLPDQDWENNSADGQAVRKDLEAGSMSNQTTLKGLSWLNWQFWHRLAKVWPAIRNIWEKKKSHKSAVELVKILVKTDKSWTKNPSHHGMDPGNIDISIFQDGKRTLKPDGELVDCSYREEKQEPKAEGELAEESQEKPTDYLKQERDLTKANDIPLLAATKFGIIEIVKEILEEYPQAIEYVNAEGLNALHVAVRNRRTRIFEYLLSYKTELPRLIRRFDSRGNSLLHQVALTEDYHVGYHPDKRPGEALQMQWEIQWFERVKKVLPRQSYNHRNNDNLTAEEWFANNHTKLATEGKEWLMRTAESCSVVAALIATVAFTSAYTIPGGNDKRNGHPVFLNKQPFLVFTASDTLSLSFALTSLVIFLSIMTSPFHQRDFYLSLPLRLVFGLSSLFLAVACMMVAFAATLFLMFEENIHLAALPIYFIACSPVTIFLYLQFPLYIRLTWYTIGDLVKSTLRCRQRTSTDDSH